MIGAPPLRARQPVITGVAVELQDTVEAQKDLFRVGAGAAGLVGEDDTGRVFSAPSAIIAGQGPEVAGLGSAASGGEDRSRGLIHEQLSGGLDVFRQPVDHGAEVEGCGACPVRQGAAVDLDAGARQDLALAVERQVVRG